jgi:hypothetical protein
LEPVKYLPLTGSLFLIAHEEIKPKKIINMEMRTL